MIGKSKPITDICMLCKDVNVSIEFYRDKLGMSLRRQAEGFADFHTQNITLALWEIKHIAEHIGYPDTDTEQPVHKIMTALEMDSCEEVDRMYQELKDKGVPFINPPKEYKWNAYCTYFSDPDDNLWELYAWVGEGAEAYHETFSDN